jgi:hypothetical protein
MLTDLSDWIDKWSAILSQRGKFSSKDKARMAEIGLEEIEGILSASIPFPDSGLIGYASPVKIFVEGSNELTKIVERNVRQILRQLGLKLDIELIYASENERLLNTYGIVEIPSVFYRGRRVSGKSIDELKELFSEIVIH